MKKIVQNEEQMLELAAEYAKTLESNTVIFLHGDLGAGKTTFVRGVLRALGYTGNVKSPTYTLVETYDFEKFNIYHFDLYRLADPEELEWIGIRDYFDNKAVSFIEWSEKGQGFLPEADRHIYIKYIEAGTRELDFRD
ncbi:tRNA (adenosine(37)-N6)-threonylcarbamoyltransferase complex ATPase subunit type 1 TsaE [Francisella frigiditurris]|uniref:tRNA threonylcarbamoyladenosine biosynthesis protein TsaE n=1 Tax=Francisella frigiditurris TaxID=1542390 RepID=A0A1J0KSA8_9GAMM|nr:tRNA (adenosine(37)-N6)-threonylcarbamoyltransferase complex ATPase subunit type 1 TsaE [Francisella frigiditurris]APC96688.1 tRNA threonylcarbamoyl adenosine modification protein YjeE [Francisella frigiditurris]